MAARSLRAQLLRMLLPPIAALLALGAAIAYYAASEPTTEAYDQALVDIGIALGAHIHAAQGEYRLELPAAVEKMLRTDRYDVIFYRVLDPGGVHIAGDHRLAAPAGDAGPYNGVFSGEKVRVVNVETPCAGASCTVLVAETTNKRARAAREFLLTSLVPGLLIAAATLLIVWFGVKRGLWPRRPPNEEK
jgi:two-component system sensor histidine kinase TctE